MTGGVGRDVMLRRSMAFIRLMSDGRARTPRQIGAALGLGVRQSYRYVHSARAAGLPMRGLDFGQGMGMRVRFETGWWR